MKKPTSALPRIKAEPCFCLRKSWKLVRFPGTFPTFIQWLKDQRLLMADREPYQKHLSRGLFFYTLVPIKPIGRKVCVTRVTIKGLYLIKQRLKRQKQSIQPTP